MALEPINYGAAANDGTGDNLRESMRKSQANFVYLDQGKVDKVAGMGLSSNNFTNAERVKLGNIAEGASNDRSKHTGTQTLSSISDAGTAAAGILTDGHLDYTEGRVLRVGDFGLGVPLNVASPGNCDDIKNPGTYSVSWSTANWVSPDAGGTLVVAKHSDFVQQLAIVAVTAKTYVRGFNSAQGNWGSWQELASASSVSSAIALANTYQAVPATYKGPMVVVNQPHYRFMVWNGVKYVRAPWHMPGVLFYSTAPAASITHGIQVRSDVAYNTADHPDLAEILGIGAATFVLPDGRARVLRSTDLGRGIDSSLVNGYLQEDAIRNITGNFAGNLRGAWMPSGVFASDPSSPASAELGSGANWSMAFLNFNASRQVPTANENRVKSLSATLYVTR